jgi:hypothetical protein
MPPPDVPVVVPGMRFIVRPLWTVPTAAPPPFTAVPELSGTVAPAWAKAIELESANADASANVLSRLVVSSVVVMRKRVINR